MAFQQPQRQQAAGPLMYAAPAPPLITVPQRQTRVEESQEWILFSPGAGLARSRTASSDQTPRTAGRSRLSDFGSLNTAAASEVVAWDTGRVDGETEDLDSLDDGLHAFNEPYSPARRKIEQSEETVLPAHDGLGAFAGNSSPLQEQFWQHERYNPKRRRYSLRRSSLQRRFEVLAEEDEKDAEERRRQRIEQWRVEQSQAILDEIERETRKMRRRSRMNASRIGKSGPNLPDHTTCTTSNASQASSPPPVPKNENFWQKFTRRVIRDLMGFDDATLSFIFGEALPPVPEESPAPGASEIMNQAEQAVLNHGELLRTADSWEGKFLERIARELGVLVHHISEHPGAFSTYLRTQEPTPYAGLPMPQMTTAEFSHPILPHNNQALLDTNLNSTAEATTSAHFAPTLARQHRRRKSSMSTIDPSLWGIEEEEKHEIMSSCAVQAWEEENVQRERVCEREYWERDLDVKMVFDFLRNRLSSSPPEAVVSSSSAAAARRLETTSESRSLRRAALIRQQHPLVSDLSAASLFEPPKQNTRFQPSYMASSSTPLSPILGRRRSCASSSCASQSTKRSKTARSGSSRNYWDLGGGVANAGGWGEV